MWSVLWLACGRACKWALCPLLPESTRPFENHHMYVGQKLVAALKCALVSGIANVGLHALWTREPWSREVEFGGYPLAEVAGVLDQVVMHAGLSSGSYLLLRSLAQEPDGKSLTALAAEFRAEPDEVAAAAKSLSTAGLVDVEGMGVVATGVGRQAIEEIDARGNEAIREYVLERPHSATVYGLVASMQAGRFTVEDLIAFLLEPDDEEPGAG